MQNLFKKLITESKKLIHSDAFHQKYRLGNSANQKRSSTAFQELCLLIPTYITIKEKMFLYGMDFVDKVFDCCKKYDIEPLVTISHLINVFDKGIMRSEKKSKFPMYHNLLTCGPHL